MTRARGRTVPVRIPEAVAERLQVEADARGIGRDWMAGKLLEEAIENLAPAEEFSLVRKRRPAPPPQRLDPIKDEPS